MSVDSPHTTLETYTAIAASSSLSNFVIIEGATLSLHRTDAPDQEKDVGGERRVGGEKGERRGGGKGERRRTKRRRRNRKRKRRRTRTRRRKKRKNSEEEKEEEIEGQEGTQKDQLKRE